MSGCGAGREKNTVERERSGSRAGAGGSVSVSGAVSGGYKKGVSAVSRNFHPSRSALSQRCPVMTEGVSPVLQRRGRVEEGVGAAGARARCPQL